MNSPMGEGTGRVETALPVLLPSAGVQLEIAILDATHDVPRPHPATIDERPKHPVLVVAAESDLRCYVRECLRERTDILVLEAETIAAAVVVVARDSPKILIVDEPESGFLAVSSGLRTILLVDDVPRSAPPDARLRLLARPFSAERLLTEVNRLLV